VKNFEPVVFGSILEVVQEKQPAITEVKSHQALNADLGLKSLDLARIVANLEMALEADPFAEQVAITSIRTVGDLLNAYRRYFDGDAAPQNQELEEGQRRARARQEALASVQGRRSRASTEDQGEPDAS
jgi:acyl carrier protein